MLVCCRVCLSVIKTSQGSHETPFPIETRPEEFKVQSLTGALGRTLEHTASAELSMTSLAGNQQYCSGGVFVLLTKFLGSIGCFLWLLVWMCSRDASVFLCSLMEPVWLSALKVVFVTCAFVLLFFCFF